MLKRSDGRWQDQIKLPGMQKPKYFYGKTQKEVKQKMAAWQKEQVAGKTFEFVSDRWLEEKGKEIAYNTEKSYSGNLKKIQEHFSGRSIDSIKADEVNAYIRYMSAQGYSRQTISLHQTLLTMVFDYAIVNRWTDSNPCGAVKLPRDLPKETRELPTDEQLQKVRDGVGLEFGLFPFMLMYTGMRRGELLALRWEDIDQENRCIYVNKTVCFVGGAPRITTPKTEAGNRCVVLLDALREVLPDPGKGYVFGGEKPLTASVYRRLWRHWIEAAGLATSRVERKKTKSGREYNNYILDAEITPHQLRHAFATILYDAGVDAKDAQDLLGHANMNTTMNIYTHIRQSRREATAAKINRFLAGDDKDDEKMESCQNVVKFPKAL